MSIRTRRASSDDPPAHAAHAQHTHRFRWGPARVSGRWCSTVTGAHSSPNNSNTYTVHPRSPPSAGVGVHEKGSEVSGGEFTWTGTWTGLYTWDGLGVPAGVVARKGRPRDRGGGAHAAHRTFVAPALWVLSSEGWPRRTIVDTMPFFYWEVCEQSSAASTGIVCGAVTTA